MAEEDVEIVKNLPVKFVSISKPSPAIIKMLEKRKEAHESLILNMKEDIIKINEKIDEEIKTKSEEMKRHLIDIKHHVKKYFIDVKFKLKNLEIEDDYYKKAKKILMKFNQKELEVVNDFCFFLHNVEESRLKKFKGLLKENKWKAVQIAHELPFMLDEFFEKQIMEINKITLSNCQHYGEIEKELKLQNEYDLKLWFEELLEIKEMIKNELKSLVKRYTLFDDLTEKDPKASELVIEVRRFNSLKSYFQYQVFSPEDDEMSVTSLEIEKWLKSVQKWLGALDKSAKNIVQLYKSTITVLFHRYLGELTEIKNNIGTGGGVVHTNEVDPYNCEMYTPNVDQLNIQHLNDLANLQEYWGHAIQEMTENINTTFSFLKGATGLWDRHFVRIKELQVLVLRDLENTIKQNGSSSDCHEANLNIVLEELRQGCNVRELDKSLENVKKILDKMEETYIWDAKCEIQVVTKYKTMMETGIEVLISELKRFLTVHPPDYEKDPKKQRRRASQISMREQEQGLPLQILYCVFQVGAVKNWMFGLWEAIDQYINACKQEIIAQVDTWIEAQTEKIQERLKMKLMFSHPRYQQVKCANYEKRLKELKLHTDLLHHHINAAEKKNTEFKQHHTIYEEKCEELCNIYNEECNTMLENLPKTNNSFEAKHFNVTIKEKLVPIQDEIKSMTDDYIESSQRFVEELKLYNYQFLSSVRLFNEGGNFNMDEINDLYKELHKLEEVTEKDIQNHIKEMDTKFWRYASRVQSIETNLLANLTKVIHEHGHNEKLARKMNKLQKDLKDHVVELKKSFCNIDKKLQRLNNEALNNLGDKKYLDDFVPQFQNFLKEVVDVYNYMSHPEPVEIYLVHNNKSLTRTQSSKKADYLEQVFRNLPDPDGTDFITKTLQLLRNSLVDVATNAQEFYANPKNHCHILDDEKLQPTYEDCLIEILGKYKPYLIQCEICWLENAVNFMSILNSIKNFKEDFITAFETSFYKKCMLKFEQNIRNVMDKLKQDEKAFTDNLNQIYYRLKVLFGHPKNNEMLNQLQRDYDEIHADHQAKFRKILKPRMEYLDTVTEETKSEIEKLSHTLPILARDEIIYEVIEHLLLQIKTKRSLLNTIVSEIKIESNHIPFKDSVIQHIQNYFQNSTNEIKPCQTETKAAPSLVTVSSEQAYSSAQEFLTVLNDTLRMTKTKMEEFVQQNMMKSLEDFKNIWDSEIRYILSLYKVKYDEDIF